MPRLAVELIGLTSAGLLGLTGCFAVAPERSPRRSPQAQASSPDLVSSSPPATPNIAASTPSPSQSPTPTVTVELFQVDDQCANLIPTPVVVSAQRSLEEAIEKLLATQDSGDFSLSGFRVKVEGGTATVDLRTAAASPRSLHSLSMCEQLALFGGLRQTLTSNPQWGIQSVRFTEQGQEIEL